MINFEQMFSLLERIDPQYRQYKQLINEADSRLKAVDRIIDQVFSNYFNPDDIVRSSEYYVNDNPNTTWRQYLLFNLRHTFGLMQNSDVKYLPLVARLAYSNEVRFDLSNDNSEQINTLRRIVNLFKKDDNLFNEVKNNPNITFGQLAERFKETFAQEDAADSEAANSVQNTNSEYTIKEVPDFETAKYYGDRSCSSSKLCYTQSEYTWNQYTRSGMNSVYVCLRNGWENIPEKATEGNPYDLYGTSMIFVFVNPNGDLVTSNCRWNHANVGEYNGNVDHAFTKATLSQTIGMPFDSVFEPKVIDKETYIRRAIEEGDYKTMRDIAVGDFVIPDGVRVIGFAAFYDCDNLTSITIPNSVTEICDSAFYDCSGLTSINIPNSVTSIDDNAFGGCTSLTRVTIPNSVTYIGGAFYRCKSLTSVTINNNSIVSANYDENYNIKSVFGTQVTEYIIGNGVTEIGDCAFAGCRSLTSINIPNSVTSIGYGAFYGCRSLTSITIPSSVTSISEDTFGYCSSLTSIKIPNSVTYIGDGAFDNCINLTSIEIPSSVTYIGKYAFGDYFKLTTVYVESEQTANLVRGSEFKGNIQYIK